MTHPVLKALCGIETVSRIANAFQSVDREPEVLREIRPGVFATVSTGEPLEVARKMRRVRKRLKKALRKPSQADALWNGLNGVLEQCEKAYRDG